MQRTGSSFSQSTRLPAEPDSLECSRGGGGMVLCNGVNGAIRRPSTHDFDADRPENRSRMRCMVPSSGFVDASVAARRSALTAGDTRRVRSSSPVCSDPCPGNQQQQQQCTHTVLDERRRVVAGGRGRWSSSVMSAGTPLSDSSISSSPCRE